MKTPSSASLLPALLLSAAAQADDFVLREHTFDLSGITEVDIEGSVGEMKIELIDGMQMSVVLEIEGKDEGWFSGDKDVSNVDLESQVQNGRLVLRMDEEETETQWTIGLPQVARLDIDFGVGAVHASVGDTAVDLNMGVGEVVIDAPRASAGRIDLHVGVGEANISGARDQDGHRAFVSHEIDGQGDGDKRISVDLGVGDLRVNLD